MIKTFVKSVAAVLVVTFLTTEVSFAQPAFTGAGMPPVSQNILSDPFSFQAPLESVTLKDIHKGTGETLIIHIQDAHSNLSGQENLAAALDKIMTDYHVSLVLTEGGAGECSLTPLRKMAPDEKVLKRAAKKHLMLGNIAGEEYLNLTSDLPMKIMGIEDMNLYMESLRNYAALAGQRDAILEKLQVMRSALEKLKTKLYPPALLEYEKTKVGKTFGKDSLRPLLVLAKGAGVPLAGFPDVEKLSALSDKESTIDFDAANLEEAALVEALQSKKSHEDLASYLDNSKHLQSERTAQASFLNHLFDLAVAENVSLKAYPHLKIYADYLTDFMGVDLEKAVDELQSVEDRAYEKLLEKPDARLVRAIDRYTALLVTAYHIQMSTNEFKTFQANEPDYSTMACLAFINRKLMEFGYYGELIPYDGRLEDGKKALEAFYDSVAKRDMAFIQNAQNIMASENQKVAVLISGGYHTSHLEKLFRDQGYSYVVLTPIVTAETNQKKYEKLLLAPVAKEAKAVEHVEGLTKDDAPLTDLPPDLRKPGKPEGVKVAEVVFSAARLSALAADAGAPRDITRELLRSLPGAVPVAPEGARLAKKPDLLRRYVLNLLPQLEHLGFSEDEVVESLKKGGETEYIVPFGFSAGPQVHAQLQLFKKALPTLIRAKEAKGDKSLSVFAAGLGWQPQEAVEITSAVDEVLKATVKDPEKWTYRFVGIDSSEGPVKNAQLIFDMILHQRNIGRKVKIKIETMKAETANVWDAAELARIRDEFFGRTLPDILLNRHASYANWSAQAGQLSQVPNPGVDDQVSAGKYLAIFLALQNMLAVFGKPGSFFLFEPSEKFMETNEGQEVPVILLPEAELITARQVFDKNAPKKGSIGDRGSGVLWFPFDSPRPALSDIHQLADSVRDSVPVAGARLAAAEAGLEVAEEYNPIPSKVVLTLDQQKILRQYVRIGRAFRRAGFRADARRVDKALKRLAKGLSKVNKLEENPAAPESLSEAMDVKFPALDAVSRNVDRSGKEALRALSAEILAAQRIPDQNADALAELHGLIGAGSYYFDRTAGDGTTTKEIRRYLARIPAIQRRLILPDRRRAARMRLLGREALISIELLSQLDRNENKIYPLPDGFGLDELNKLAGHSFEFGFIFDRSRHGWNLFVGNRARAPLGSELHTHPLGLKGRSQPSPSPNDVIGGYSSFSRAGFLRLENPSQKALSAEDATAAAAIGRLQRIEEAGKLYYNRTSPINAFAAAVNGPEPQNDLKAAGLSLSFVPAEEIRSVRFMPYGSIRFSTNAGAIVEIERPLIPTAPASSKGVEQVLAAPGAQPVPSGFAGGHPSSLLSSLPSPGISEELTVKSPAKNSAESSAKSLKNGGEAVRPTAGALGAVPVLGARLGEKKLHDDTISVSFHGSAFIQAGSYSFAITRIGDHFHFQRYDEKGRTSEGRIRIISSGRSYQVGRQEGIENFYSIAGDKRLSRKHFSFRIEPNAFGQDILTVTDLASTRGTAIRWQIQPVEEGRFQVGPVLEELMSRSWDADGGADLADLKESVRAAFEDYQKEDAAAVGPERLERLFALYFDRDFLEDYRSHRIDLIADHEFSGAELRNQMRAYTLSFLRMALKLLASSSVFSPNVEAFRGEDPKDYLSHRKLFYRIYGNLPGENFNNQEILPVRLLTRAEAAVAGRKASPGEMVILGSFKSYSEIRGDWRYFVRASYQGRTFVFYRSASHRLWRRVELYFKKSIQKPVAESALDLHPSLSRRLDTLDLNAFPEGTPDNLLKQWGVSIEPRQIDARVMESFTRYGFMNTAGREKSNLNLVRLDPESGMEWFRKNLPALRGETGARLAAEGNPLPFELSEEAPLPQIAASLPVETNIEKVMADTAAKANEMITGYRDRQNPSLQELQAYLAGQNAYFFAYLKAYSPALEQATRGRLIGLMASLQNAETKAGSGQAVPDITFSAAARLAGETPLARSDRAAKVAREAVPLDQAPIPALATNLSPEARAQALLTDENFKNLLFMLEAFERPSAKRTLDDPRNRQWILLLASVERLKKALEAAPSDEAALTIALKDVGGQLSDTAAAFAASEELKTTGTAILLKNLNAKWAGVLLQPEEPAASRLAAGIEEIPRFSDLAVPAAVPMAPKETLSETDKTLITAAAARRHFSGVPVDVFPAQGPASVVQVASNGLRATLYSASGEFIEMIPLTAPVSTPSAIMPALPAGESSEARVVAQMLEILQAQDRFFEDAGARGIRVLGGQRVVFAIPLTRTHAQEIGFARQIFGALSKGRLHAQASLVFTGDNVFNADGTLNVEQGMRPTGIYRVMVIGNPTDALLKNIKDKAGFIPKTPSRMERGGLSLVSYGAAFVLGSILSSLDPKDEASLAAAAQDNQMRLILRNLVDADASDLVNSQTLKVVKAEVQVTGGTELDFYNQIRLVLLSPFPVNEILVTAARMAVAIGSAA